MPRTVLCPFYIDDSRLTVSCEDSVHPYETLDQKATWMDEHCYANWESCPHAAALSAAYERAWKGEKDAVEKHEVKTLRKEMKGLLVRIGKADKQVERLQKKVEELQALNDSYQRKTEELEQRRRETYKKWRAAQGKIDQGDSKINEELVRLGTIYEQRMCYLLATYAPDGAMYEDNINDWAGDKSFALVADYEGPRLKWKVVFEDEDISAEKKNE
jgi:hypothetical protein